MTIRIATRGSALALTQSRWVAARLTELCPDVATELVLIKTEGDLRQDRPLAAIGGRGVFVKAIEDALLAGQADAAVHSLKDMPSELPAGLVLAAIPEREDPRDALVLPVKSAQRTAHSAQPDEGSSPPGGHAASDLLGRVLCAVRCALPSGARVGTSGPRRRAMLLNWRPDIRVADVRGNLDTRLRKLDAGEYEALILATAGLRRLGLSERISFPLPVDVSVPAVGQGALAVEARAGDTELITRLRLLDHAPTRACVTAERAALARLRGGCTVPFGAHASLAAGVLTLHGMIADTAGTRLLRHSLSGPADDPTALGTRLAEALLAAGGADLMAGDEG